MARGCRADVAWRRVACVATLVTVLLGVGASAQAEPSDEAPLVTAWFATAGADAVRDADAGDPGFVEGLDTARTVTFGEPVPVSTIAVPGYDLAAAAPDGPTDYASTVSPTGSWCARVVLDQVPRDLAVCVTVADDGTVAWESTEQLRFLGDKESLGASALFHQRGRTGSRRPRSSRSTTPPRTRSASRHRSTSLSRHSRGVRPRCASWATTSWVVRRHCSRRRPTSGTPRSRPRSTTGRLASPGRGSRRA